MQSATANTSTEVSKLQELLQLMKQDNEMYRKNFENLKNEYLELQNFYNDQHLRWRTQLENKSSEFEVLKKRFDRESQELETMKIKLVEELEIRQRLERDIVDADRFRNMYNDLRRSFEIAKSEHLQQVENMQKQMQELKTEKETMVAELQNKLQEQRKLMSTHKHAETVRQLEKENEELRVRVKQLLQEVTDVREEKARITGLKEQAAIVQSQQYAELLTKSRSFESENERYRKKIERMTEELEDANRQNDKMHETILRFEKENVQLHHQMEEQLQSFNSERSILKANYEQRDRESERDRQSLKNQLAEYSSRIEALQLQKQELFSQLTDTKTEITENTRKIINEANERCSRLENQKNVLTDQLHELERTLLQSQRHSKDEIHRLTKDLEVLRSTSETVVAERDDYKEKFIQLQNNTIPQLRRELDNAEQEARTLQDKIQSFYRQIDSKNQEVMDLTSTNERMKMNTDFLEKQIEELTGSLDRTKNHVKLAQTQAAQQALEQLHQLQDKYSQLKQKSNSTISKYKEQKKKLVQHVENLRLAYSKTKQQNEILSQQISKSEELTSQLQNEIWQEKQQASRQGSQMERELRKLQFIIEQKDNERIRQSDQQFSENYQDLYSSTVKQMENLAERVSKFSESRNKNLK